MGGAHRDDWRAALPPEFNAEVDAALELRQTDLTLDDETYFKALRRKCASLIEIRIEFELEADDPRADPPRQHQKPKRQKVVIRVLGFGGADDFVLLYGFRKRGGPDYGPACATALRRKVGVERDGRRAQPCRFP